jgi:cellulose synthase/poly-beta-1,6-N-acetylglucosamine synthase-like glycosyltransferase
VVVPFNIWVLASLIASWVARRARPRLGAVSRDTTVAILYTACDDFDPVSCSFLLQQEGVDCDLYILDDSTLPGERQRIDDWVAAQADSVRVVRRSSRSGFKAGNINHWLSYVERPVGYAYLLLVDADTELSPGDAAELARHLEGTVYAFAQACHVGRGRPSSSFQSLLEPLIECKSLHLMPARNVIGLPTMVGRGALLRTAAVDDVGGFPQLVSEDLALTAVLAMNGWRGVIAHEVVVGDASPPDYAAAWRQRQRWVSADAELVRRLLWRLLRSPVPVYQKLDFALRELGYPAVTIVWLLLVVLSTGLVLSTNQWMVLPVWTWLLLGTFLAPWMPALWSTTTPLRGRLMFFLTSSSLSIEFIPLYPLASIRGLRGGVDFSPTGSRRSPVLGSPLYVSMDMFSSILFTVAGTFGGNLILVGIGVVVAASSFSRSLHSSMIVLHFGTLLFWVAVFTQIGIDVSRGEVPADHLIALAGLPLLR